MEQIADVSITADNADWLADFTRSIVNDRLAACVPVIDANPAYRDWVLASTLDEPHRPTQPSTRRFMPSVLAVCVSTPPQAHGLN